MIQYHFLKHEIFPRPVNMNPQPPTAQEKEIGIKTKSNYDNCQLFLPHEIGRQIV